VIKGVVFDFDGTLVDSMRLIYRVLNEALKKQGLPLIELDLLGRMAGRTLAEIIRLKSDISESGLKEIRKELFDGYMQGCKTDCPLLPNVINVLKELKSRGIKLGIFTTTPRKPLDTVMNRFKLKDYFDILMAKENVKSKPNPDGLVRIIEEFGIRKEECLYVGDSPTDILAGKAAGVKTVVIPTGISTVEQLKEKSPDIVITDLIQVLKYLD
jgi:HAD superfamily hydrolase (TIGR01509 family)